MKCTYDPKEMADAPIGMFHCPECGEMVVAGIEHPDYSILERGKKMNIAFDLDGVLYPWQTAIYNYLLRNKANFQASYRELWTNPYGYFSEEEWEYLASIPLNYSTIIPKESILKLVWDIDSAGHTIYYITNREKSLVLATVNYLEDYKFPQQNNLVFTKDKNQEVRIREIDLIVEDKPKNLESLSGLCKVIGIEHPWNENEREHLESLGVLFIPSVENLRDILL